MATAVYFDESGYTGGALLDPVQPDFCVASSLIGDAEAAEILDACFPGYGGEEFKFQKLWRRPASRSRLQALSAALGARADALFIWCVDKRFCVLVKLIDHMIEPVFHARGLDFYANGHAAQFSNYLHFSLLADAGRSFYDALIGTYYAFARDPTETRLRVMQRKLGLMARSAPADLQPLVGMAHIGALTFHDHADIKTFKATMEIQLTSVLSSVGYWRQRVDGPLELFHDASNNFFGQADRWGAITRADVPPQLLPVANDEPLPFPLGIGATHAVDSRDSPSIQLCDLLAGLAVKSRRPAAEPAMEAFRMQLLEAGLGTLNSNGIWPEPSFPRSAPALLSGPDAVDRMAKIIRDGLKG
jgi:hypothetical protein